MAPPPRYGESKPLKAIYLITSVGMMTAGLGFLIGPAEWQTSSAYVVLREMLPIMAWGWLFLAVGLLKLFLFVWNRKGGEHLRFGSTLGGAVAFAWAGGLVAAAVTSGIMGWSAIPAWLTIASVQLVSAARIWQ